jgi:L-cysteine S-thiosulfotransferase
MMRQPLVLAGFLGAFLGFSVPCHAEIPLKDRRSGFEMMRAETKAMQQNDLANPGMLWVREGEALWQAHPEGGGQTCAGCHREASANMKGVAARYPALDAATLQPIDLAGKIQQCRTERQKAAPWPRESKPLLALTAYIGLQSRGMPITPGTESALAEAAARGRTLFTRRLGQLNLACANCHDDNWGQKLGSATIPQGHATGYPLYRLEWQGLGSLQRRMRNCLTGVRAEPFGPDAAEWVDLEAYLMQRAAGMPIETPAVRP